MRINEVMTQPIHVIKPDTPIQEAARLMRNDDLGALPVAENEKLIGMLTDRDIVVRAIAEGKDLTTPVRQILTDKVLYCFEDEPIEEAAENMAKNQVRRLPVLNRDKRLVGIVSLGDLAVEGKSAKSADALKGVSKPTH